MLMEQNSPPYNFSLSISSRVQMYRYCMQLLKLIGNREKNILAITKPLKFIISSPKFYYDNWSLWLVYDFMPDC